MYVVLNVQISWPYWPNQHNENKNETNCVTKVPKMLTINIL